MERSLEIRTETRLLYMGENTHTDELVGYGRSE